MMMMVYEEGSISRSIRIAAKIDLERKLLSFRMVVVLIYWGRGSPFIVETTAWIMDSIARCT